jgi:uncharacterized protein YcfJ
MSYESMTIGQVANTAGEYKDVSIPGALLILGGAAVGTYVGLQIGGGIGAAVGALVGGFIGALAAGFIKEFSVTLYPDGKVDVWYETRF